MIISLMILLWAGIAHLGSVYANSLGAKSIARSCAWRVSASSCQHVPEGCEVSIGRGKESSHDEELEKSANQATGEGLVAKIARVTLLDQITSLFSKRARASSSREFKKPHKLGGENVVIAQHFSLPCNSKGQSKKDEDEMNDRAINAIKGKSQ